MTLKIYAVVAAVLSTLAAPALMAQQNASALTPALQSAALTEGNKLFIHQEGVSYSAVAGVDVTQSTALSNAELGNSTWVSLLRNKPAAATQLGGGNSAVLSAGDRSYIGLMQNSLDAVPVIAHIQPALIGPGLGNQAFVSTGSDAFASVLQLGEMNSTLLQVAGGATGSVSQFGHALEASLKVKVGAEGHIVQVGSGSVASLTVSAGPSVTLVQKGNNLVSHNPMGVMVSSNITSAPITIVQTQNGISP